MVALLVNLLISVLVPSVIGKVGFAAQCSSQTVPLTPQGCCKRTSRSGPLAGNSSGTAAAICPLLDNVTRRTQLAR